MPKENKKAVPKEHWEIQYNPCPVRDSKGVMGQEFNPKKSSDRTVTYNKVNKEDH